jgi:hypothetical protein
MLTLKTQLKKDLADKDASGIRLGYNGRLSILLARLQVQVFNYEY